MRTLWTVMVAGMVVAGLTPGTPVTHGGDTTVECRGEPAVVADAEYWSGTQRRDVVVASSDVVDTLNLLGGDDLACVYGNPDRPYHGMVVNAGEGNDTVITYSGSHELYGEAGDDILYLHGYEDWVDGGSGSDHVWGLGSGRVFAYGQSGTDMLQGSAGADTLEGGPDGDLIIGAGGADALRGDDGDDTIQGGTGVDNLNGGGGTDLCDDDSGSTFASCETITLGPPLGEAG